MKVFLGYKTQPPIVEHHICREIQGVTPSTIFPNFPTADVFTSRRSDVLPSICRDIQVDVTRLRIYHTKVLLGLPRLRDSILVH